MTEPCAVCRCQEFREIGTIGSKYWVRCVGCGCMISHDPEPRSEECPSCGEITDADTYNGGGFQFECADCGTTWQH